jgi:hypothetical protein
MINNILGIIKYPLNYTTRISSIINAIAISLFCWNNQLSFAVDHILGYILCDFIIVTINYKEFNDYREIAVHHISCFLMCYFGYNYLYSHPELCKTLLLMEVSTIFSNIRWFMNYHNIGGIYYLINGFLFWLSFGLFRILPINKIYQEIIIEVPTFLICFIPLSILNLKWFYLITKGLMKKIFTS